MSKQPKVSVIVAAYNVAEYLPECLDSLLKQTYGNLEILVIDDGSTDETGKICDAYAQKSSLVKVIHQDNQGLSMVRNNGIQKSTGEYLAFIDGDDYVSPDYIDKLVANLGDGEIAVCGYHTVPDASNDVQPRANVVSGEDATIQLLTEQENYQIVSWNKLYKKSLFQEVNFPAGQKYEDSRTTYKILSLAQKVTFIEERLYFYRQRSGSIMNQSKLQERLEARRLTVNEAKNFFANQPRLLDAVSISEVLYHYAVIDNQIAGRLPAKVTTETDFYWLKCNKQRLWKNPFLSTKLKSYLQMSTLFGGALYKVFRRIKH